MNYLIHKIETFAFIKPLLICGISEVIFATDHALGNLAFIFSTIYAIIKLTKEDKKK